jgi:hypothetical protein
MDHRVRSYSRGRSSSSINSVDMTTSSGKETKEAAPGAPNHGQPDYEHALHAVSP